MVGKIDSRLGGLRARFEVLPDAPVTKFTMTLRGGEHGIIANATDICAFPQVATAKFIGQDNDTEAYRIQLKSTSCEKKKKHRHKARRGRPSMIRASAGHRPYLVLALALSAPASVPKMPNHPFERALIGGVEDPNRNRRRPKLENPCGVAVTPTGDSLRLRLRPAIGHRLHQPLTNCSPTTAPAGWRRRRNNLYVNDWHGRRSTRQRT